MSVARIEAWLLVVYTRAANLGFTEVRVSEKEARVEAGWLS